MDDESSDDNRDELTGEWGGEEARDKKTDWFNASIVTNNLKLFTFFAAVSIKPLYCNLQRVLFLFTYAKLEYVSVCTYSWKNRIRKLRLRILESWYL